MRIMLDCSPAKIAEYSARYGYEFGQLRTPLTKYSRASVPYILDNGCFERFLADVWLRLLSEAVSDKPIFVCLPDIVGDAARTLELFRHFKARVKRLNLPLGLVLQDGIERHASIPWRDLAGVFIGGTDEFKSSDAAKNAAKTARMLGLWVHVGRVNTAARVLEWIDLADSCDGSGISRFDHMLEGVLLAIRGPRPQLELVARA